MTPSRISGLQRLEAFLPKAGRDYAQTRNFDFGPENRNNVSMLSPWLRHRLICEDEVLQRVLACHSAEQAEKFVQEVCWRTYWKGWLEMRPGVWSAYRQDVIQHKQALCGRDARLFDQAVKGQTGIECFDAWCSELESTGYLHNHARMWFASIWVFTLRLPWTLGADYFMQHLIDGDAASNTLSWRWVAGLQTIGKTYLARESNIAHFTDGRFPATPGLAQQAEPIVDDRALSLETLTAPEPALDGRRSAWLVLDDDLSVEQHDVDLVVADEALIIETDKWRSLHPVGPQVASFIHGATADAVQRLGVAATRVVSEPGDVAWVAELVDWCRDRGIEQLLCPYVPVGPSRDALAAAMQALVSADINLVQRQREWDLAAWPHATKGFFRFKKQIPSLLDSFGLASPKAQTR